MKKLTLLFICIVIVALLFGAWKAYDGFFFEKDKQSELIKCHYMAYSCGDCYPQWQIDSIYAMENGLKELIGKDIYVENKGKAVEELVTDTVSKCLICYDFYFTGSLKKTLSGKFKFETDKYKMELRFKDCCN